MCPIANIGNANLDMGILDDIRRPPHTNIAVAIHFIVLIDINSLLYDVFRRS
jgi:hypothetical protein